MMRSFQYAAYSALWQQSTRAEDVWFLEPWADTWYRHISRIFLRSYLETSRGAVFIPKQSDDLQVLLEAYLLDKAVYEVAYELNNRPDWVVIPLRGIRHILQMPRYGLLTLNFPAKSFGRERRVAETRGGVNFPDRLHATVSGHANLPNAANFQGPQ